MVGAFMTHAIILTAIGLASTYPSGAPDTQCLEMRPGHRNATGTLIDSQNEFSFPYQVNCKELWNGRVKVTIKGKLGGVESLADFRGALVQVRNSTGALVGKVMKANASFQKVCGDQAATHTGNEDKNKVRVIFKLSVEEKTQQNLACVVTVVKSFEEFWVQHQVPLIQNISNQ